jgi:hypothetical protein
MRITNSKSKNGFWLYREEVHKLNINKTEERMVLLNPTLVKVDDEVRSIELKEITSV